MPRGTCKKRIRKNETLLQQDANANFTAILISQIIFYNKKDHGILTLFSETDHNKFISIPRRD